MSVEISFTEWLNGEMEKKNWKPADLCREAKIDSGFLSKVLSGIRNPGKMFVNRVAVALNYPPDFVARMAGLLPPEKEKDPSDEELLFLFQKLTDQEKEIIRAQVRALVERNK